MTADICLGFDTSNYTTSAAFFDGSCGANSGKLLSVPEGKTGLRQNDVLFRHVKQLPEVVSRLKYDKSSLKAIGASASPRETAGSYMPCFLAGMTMGQVLAETLGISYYEFSHQQGHVAAAAWSSDNLGLLDKRHMAWHLSGGTTELLLVEPNGKGISCRKIGGSTDISAGQLIDRTGVKLGLSFPAGKELDSLAMKAEKPQGFKIKLFETEFSLSGMENKVMDMMASEAQPRDMAAFVFQSIADVLIKAGENAVKKYGKMPILFSGGVSASAFLKSRLDGIFSAPQYASDNALGIAILTYRTHKPT